jgi:hypothetical protein
MLGNQLLEALAESQKSEVAAVVVEASVNQGATCDSHMEFGEAPAEIRSSCPSADFSADDNRRADAPHVRFDGSREATRAESEMIQPEIVTGPSQVLSWHHHEAVESLERLDDLVFEAIAGKPGAFAELKQFWPTVLAELGPNLLHESREQYVKHALRVWRECVEGDQIRNPQLAIAAMDVVCLILGD